VNISTIIDAAAAADPDRAALITDGRRITYGELADAVQRCADRLCACGVSGKRVAVVDVGSLLSVATMLGAARIGGAAALINPALTPQEIAGLLANAGCADVGVAGEAYAGRLVEAGAAKALTATDLLSNGRVAAPPTAHDVDDRDALVLFTSGTTGLPKAIGITQRQLNARITGVTTPFRAAVAPTVTMMTVPFFHVGGAIGTLGSLYSGNTYVVQDRFDAAEWLRLVAEHKVTSTFLVPTMLQRILDHPDFGDTDLTSLVSIAYGAAAAPITLVTRAMAAMPDVAFANVFGQT
jgi:long-chain acyl-CoA synthetase